MAKMADFRTASMDGEYFVSAADLADKIIMHMWRGLDPLALFSAAPPANYRAKPD